LGHFNANNTLHSQQFGFRKGRSTTDAITSLVRYIFGAMNDSHDIIGVFCDLSKAFDCVDHSTLLAKLNHYGVKDKSLDVLQSYLSNRTQCTDVDGSKSVEMLVKMGVPQGSILGPFLFLIYVNDLPYTLEGLTNTVLFADDTSLLFKVPRNSDIAETIINPVLQKTLKWFTINNLLLNPKKTKCIRFSTCRPNQINHKPNLILGEHVLEFSDSTIFLGLTLDSKLQWDSHLAILSSKLCSAAYAVRKIRQITDINTAKLVYYSYFHCLMSYGILVWGRSANVDSIFVLQKRAVRAIYNLKPQTSLRDLFRKVDIITLPSLYIYEVIMYARKHYADLPKNSDLHKFNTRNKNKLAVHRLRLSKSRKSFIGQSIHFYNKIPSHITDLPDYNFKKHVKDILTQKSYYRVKDYLTEKDVWKDCTSN
jgi:hypothetical protein